ncbi:MAG: antA/AntB antirepressor family protein [Candidatus Magnetoovum sp. WYHC-5]|nr:antA/AntB antirepressor family protein [Candidatus Magnetoovum sp. WYHC-5]
MNVQNTSLIPIGQSSIVNNTIQTVNARDLHEFLGITSKFADWVKNRIREYGFIENQDYITFSKNLESGGRTVDYHVSLDMAKELAMVERNEKGKQARQYFIECERRLREGDSPKQVTAQSPLQTPAIARNNYAVETELYKEICRYFPILKEIDSMEFLCVLKLYRYKKGGLDKEEYRKLLDIDDSKIAEYEELFEGEQIVSGILGEFKPATVDIKAFKRSKQAKDAAKARWHKQKEAMC